ncbi:hypothetical protein HWV62_27595 [Athelia sp. TMB]|nr:hypothetical protein HWV62_27595 [Athelia sp. TMB]
MDPRPAGPRPPHNDKRTTAYADIFGRPTPPAAPPQQQHVLDRRTSHGSFAPSTYSRQSFPHHPTHQQPHAPSPAALGPPPAHPRARSLLNSPAAVSPHARPIDPSLAALTRAGLTEAQAYQAQVYLGGRPTSQPAAPPPPTPPPRSAIDPQIPTLGLTLEADDGALGLDFGASSPSDDDSELPWARAEPPAPPPQQPAPIAHRHSAAAASARPHPLQLDTAVAPSASVASTPHSLSTAASSTLVDHMTASTSSRRSVESARTLPTSVGPAAGRHRSAQDRSMSMSAASLRHNPSPSTSTPRRAPLPGRTSPTSLRTARRAAPLVYPALLSRVAAALRERLPLGDRVKDGLTYADAFDGRECVDRIAYIIKTTDRNLALLLGRALDAQKFFHDVAYEHRLRDSAGELYQFRGVVSVFGSGELAGGEEKGKANGANGENGRPGLKHNASVNASVHSAGGSSSDNHAKERDAETPTTPSAAATPLADEDEAPLPSGVFTLLTDCYSPTCTRDRLCYSIACPRRLEQHARLNMLPAPGLSADVAEAEGEWAGGREGGEGALWVHSVPPEVVGSVSEKEKRRQEAINEVMYTERDFVRDMEYLRDVWINELKDSDVLPPERRTDFLEQVFWNIHDIIAVNTRLRDALTKRQKAYAVVERIGDIMLDAVPHFGPFVSYGAHQLYGKYEFEKEKAANAAFAAFVDAAERRPESRKLELNGYLTKPTTRLARYPLLLEAVLKHTPPDSPDAAALPQAIAIVREFLGRVNVESGRTENRFNLLQLDQQLVFRPGEQVDLRLQEEGRELVYKGALSKKGGGAGQDAGDLQLYLFDHALLMVKQKSKHEQYKVYRRPIPLELLLISSTDDYAAQTARQAANRAGRTLTKSTPYVPAFQGRVEGGKGFAITFVHLGRKFYQITLWASTYVGQRKWVEHIARQQERMRARSAVFGVAPLSEGFFTGANKVNCAAPYSGGQRVVYGTDDGVYLSDMRAPAREPVKVLGLLDVAQVDVLDEYELLIVLSERQVLTFPLDALDAADPLAGLKRAKRISSHTSFFKAGVCLGKVLVCVVKSSPLSSTIKTLEPIDQSVRGRSKPTFRKLLQGGNDTLKLFREFYIPVESSSIHFLKTKLCVGCSKGFEIVDLETLDTQGLLDPADESLDFIKKRENLRPMAIYRIDNEFLLCYDEFAFYVNRTGWRSRKEFMVQWEGQPTGFAFHYPYVLAFDPSFVEVRHVLTGHLSQVIQGSNLRLIFADTPPSTTNTSAPVYQTLHHPTYGYPYGAANPYASQPSLYGSGGYAPSAHTVRQSNQPFGRDEILMVAEDRVLTLRLAMHPPPADGA